MKVKELKEILNSLPEFMGELDISADISVGCCGDTEILQGLEIDFDIDNNSRIEKSRFMIRFTDLLPGMKSCRQYADTLKRDSEYWNKDDKKQGDQ